MIYLETNDAGAFFRFTDTYSKMIGGQLALAMDPPTVEPSAKEGLINVRDFTVKGEAALERAAAGGPPGAQNGVAFSRLRAEFTRQNGQLTIREGVVKGPTIGATIEGSIDYPGNQVRMSGTFVPMYGLNNMFGQIPIVGLFLGGGSNEGLIGVTYEVVGTPGAAGAARQSDLGDGAGRAAQDLRVQHRQAEQLRSSSRRTTECSGGA